MQSLSIISVNIWQILISFANLAILTWIIKKFLFKPEELCRCDGCGESDDGSDDQSGCA